MEDKIQKFEPTKLGPLPKGVHWLDYYGLVPAGYSLVEREKGCEEVGEDCGLAIERKTKNN